MGSRMERGLGHADHRDAELSVRVSAQAGPAAGVKVGVAVDYQEAQPVQTVQDRTHRREFTQIELARPVRHYLCHDFSAFSHYLAEAGIGGHDGCGPRTPRTQIVHIHGHERALTRFHVLSLPDLRHRPRQARLFRSTAMSASQSPPSATAIFFPQTNGKFNPVRKPIPDIGKDLNDPARMCRKRPISGSWAAVGWRQKAAGGVMVWLGGPRRQGGRTKGIVLHDPPPGYRPPRPRIPLKDQQRKARQDWVLMRVATVVVVLAAAAIAVIFILIIAGYR